MKDIAASYPGGLFQSTLPVGGGTIRGMEMPNKSYNFNPPSPWGEGRRRWWRCWVGWNFNPPSPWGEGHYAG